MNEARRIAILKGIEGKLEYIGNVASMLEIQIRKEDLTYSRYTKQVLNLAKLYDDAKTELNQVEFYEVSTIMPYISRLKYPNSEQLLNMLTSIITGCVAGIKAIREILNRQAIPEELANKMESWKKEIESIDFLDEDVRRNLKDATTELEQGHILATALISGRVIIWILQQIPPEGKDIPEKDKKKVKTLIDAGIIQKDDKDLHERIFRAARLARNYFTHNIARYPALEDASNLLNDAIKLAKMYTEFKKKEIVKRIAEVMVDSLKNSKKVAGEGAKEMNEKTE